MLLVAKVLPSLGLINHAIDAEPGVPEALVGRFALLVHSPLAPSALDYLRMNLYVPDEIPSMKRSTVYSPGADLKSAVGKAIVVNLHVDRFLNASSDNVRSNGFARPLPSVSVPRNVAPSIPHR